MGPIVLAWLAGLGLISYRYINQGSPPPPGDLGVGSGAYAIAAVVGMANESLGNVFAWGITAAALLATFEGKGPAAGLIQAAATQADSAGPRLAGQSNPFSSSLIDGAPSDEVNPNGAAPGATSVITGAPKLRNS